MTIASEISRLQTAKSDIKTAINNTGLTVSDSDTLDEYYKYIQKLTYIPPKTFTISWTDKSDMSSGWTYSDDAAWLTAGSSKFDDFFWYSAVLLDESWNETAEMTQIWWVFSDTMTNFIGNSTDNVMIKFPVRWIKMTKSGNTVTLSITDEKDKAWFQYFAHTSSWNINSPWTPKDAFYLWAYKWYEYNNNNVIKLKSWSWQTPSVNRTTPNYCTFSKANWSSYQLEWFYQRMYVNALYMMKYWNPDSQTVVGWGNTNSSLKNTWWTDSQTSATYGTSSDTNQIKLFWLEDRWGNISEKLWGMYLDSSRYVRTQLTWRTWQATWWTRVSAIFSATQWEIYWIRWANASMFVPSSSQRTGWVYTTYYCDYSYMDVNQNYVLPHVWWGYSGKKTGGMFFTEGHNYYNSSTVVWGRLMYLDWLT